MTKNTSSPLALASTKVAGSLPFPVEIKLTLPVLTSYSYASSTPFLSCGSSASAVEKKTFPSGLRKRGRIPGMT